MCVGVIVWLIVLSCCGVCCIFELCCVALKLNDDPPRGNKLHFYLRKKREKKGEVECAKVDLRKNVKKGKGDRRK